MDQFETVQRRMRALAVQVLNDTASGQGVRTEYVDTQSRATHLEATAARIREFLKQAQDVDGESRPVGTGYDLARTSFGTESTCRWYCATNSVIAQQRDARAKPTPEH